MQKKNPKNNKTAEMIMSILQKHGGPRIISPYTKNEQGVKGGFCHTLTQIIKVSKVAKIRNRYNQVPHLTQDTKGQMQLTIGWLQFHIMHFQEDPKIIM